MTSLDVIYFNHSVTYKGRFAKELGEIMHPINFIHVSDYLETNDQRDFNHQDQHLILAIFDGNTSISHPLSEPLLYRLKDCVSAFKIGMLPPAATDFRTEFSKVFDDVIEMTFSLDEIKQHLLKITKKLVSPKKIPSSLSSEFSSLNLIGCSFQFESVLNLIKQIAGCDVPVLIEGETGTGKENAARSIHYLGDRQDKAFIPINCGAMPDTLFESELFGYEKGAFTDARQKHSGLIELANNGTLFLDEVDSLSPKAQAALLRFLQTGEYRPLGSKQILSSNVRVIAASNARLKHKIESRQFREDLYFRLNVLYLYMPPLRERPDDIKIIAEYLVEKFARTHNLNPRKLHPATINWLKQQAWPGNVRQLENVLLRELLLNNDPILAITNSFEDESKIIEYHDHEIQHVDDVMQFQDAKEAAITQFEFNYIQNVLALTDGNVSKAARLAGKERRAFGKLIKKYKIDKARFATNTAEMSI